MVSNQDVKVQLVNKPGSPRTGIGRYAVEIERGLSASGVTLRRAELRNPLPRLMTSAIGRLGYDVTAFTRSYPFRADTQPGYVTHLTSQTLATLLLVQRLPRPVVVTVHDILPYVLRNDDELGVYRHRADRFMDSLAMRGLKRADRLISDSAYTKQCLVDTLAIPADKIDVIHLGVDTEAFRPSHPSAEFMKRHGLSGDRRYLLFAGSEDPRKDLPTLLHALAIIRHVAPDVELIKVGAPAFEEQRRRHIDLCVDMGISGVVHWIDEVTEADLPIFYNVASVFTFPSRFEGFGFPVLEALACGTPVVAVNASSVPELVSGVAKLVPASDPAQFARAILETLDAEPVDRKTLRRHAELFTWDKTIAALHATYERASRTATSGQSIAC